MTTQEVNQNKALDSPVAFAEPLLVDMVRDKRDDRETDF
jgi:hypothetical protein